MSGLRPTSRRTVRVSKNLKPGDRSSHSGPRQRRFRTGRSPPVEWTDRQIGNGSAGWLAFPARQATVFCPLFASSYRIRRGQGKIKMDSRTASTRRTGAYKWRFISMLRFQQFVIAVAFPRLPTRIGDQRPDFLLAESKRRSRGGNHVLLHHHGSHVIGAEKQRQLTNRVMKKLTFFSGRWATFVINLSLRRAV